MLDSFLSYLTDEREQAPGTVKLRRVNLRFVEKHVGKPLPEITTQDMRTLKVRLRGRFSSSHLKNVVVGWKGFRSWGVLEGHWSPNGEAELHPPRERNISSPPLSVAQVEQLLRACNGPLEHRVIYLPSRAGLRIGEAANLTDEMWADGWLRFRGKWGRFREVPVHPRLERVREIILAHATPHKSSLQKVKERIERRVGFPFVVHQLRKTFSTCLHDGGVTDLCRRELLGHATGLDGVYTAVSRREKMEAVGRLPY